MNSISNIYSSLSIRDLLTLLYKRVVARLSGKNKFKWTVDYVFDASSIPETTTRTYLEMRDLQKYLTRINNESPIKHAADIGTGFGRLLPLLADNSEETIGFERDEDLIQIARGLNPATKIFRIADLGTIEFESAYFDLVLVFTVLQHLADAKVVEVYHEIYRLLRPGGHLLLCEQTDTSDVFGDLNDANNLLQHGRSIDQYSRIFEKLTLIDSSPRVNESTYRRKDVGSYMLFQKL